MYILVTYHTVSAIWVTPEAVLIALSGQNITTLGFTLVDYVTSLRFLKQRRVSIYSASWKSLNKHLTSGRVLRLCLPTHWSQFALCSSAWVCVRLRGSVFIWVRLCSSARVCVRLRASAYVRVCLRLYVCSHEPSTVKSNFQQYLSWQVAFWELGSTKGVLAGSRATMGARSMGMWWWGRRMRISSCVTAYQRVGNKTAFQRRLFQ